MKNQPTSEELGAIADKLALTNTEREDRLTYALLIANAVIDSEKPLKSVVNKYRELQAKQSIWTAACREWHEAKLREDVQRSEQ